MTQYAIATAGLRPSATGTAVRLLVTVADVHSEAEARGLATQAFEQSEGAGWTLYQSVVAVPSPPPAPAFNEGGAI